MNYPQKNYLNKAGVFKVKINQIIEKGATDKSKAAVYIEYIDGKNRVVSTRMNNPITDGDRYELTKLLKALHIHKKIDELKPVSHAVILKSLAAQIGKELFVFVGPYRLSPEKVLWNVIGYMATDYEPYIEREPSEVSAARAAFSGGADNIAF